ncbi:MAG: polyphosphate polymerase domain-containing protein [Oscillospiraceae bacterium]|nr:polyphosphate polymerase domain-containing protein [Oscillospiraceae bacterium]
MSEDKKPRFRHELKYMISVKEKDALIQRLKPLILRDAHAENGRYTIRSLYFDDMWGTAYNEKLLGTAIRKKYRIRIYDFSDAVIKLERKTKQGNYIYKQAADLSRAEFYSILKGDFAFLLSRQENLCKEFYVECVSNLLRPRVIVDYDREPFVYRYGDVRITFDTDVRAALLSYDIFDAKLPTLNTMQPDTLIMEVKYTEFLPQQIRNLLPQGAEDLLAFSKYIMCCEKHMEVSV